MVSPVLVQVAFTAASGDLVKADMDQKSNLSLERSFSFRVLSYLKQSWGGYDRADSVFQHYHCHYQQTELVGAVGMKL